MRKTRAWLSGGLVALAAVLLLLWWARAAILAEAARAYFRAHGIEASLSFSEVGFSGVSGSFALGPKGAPVLGAERIELRFDPARWKPYVTEVRLVRPVVRVEIGTNGAVRFGALQNWIGSLTQGKGSSEFVSPDLAVSLTGLRLLAATPAGPMEWDGDVRLFKNLPVSAHLRARPASLAWKGVTVALGSANLDYQGPQASLRITGGIGEKGLEVQGLTAEADAAGLVWDRGELRATSARFLASGQIGAAGATPINIRLVASNLVLSANASRADLQAHVRAGLKTRLSKLGALDLPLAHALEGNLARVALDLGAHLEVQGKTLQGQLTAPLTVEGAEGGILQVPMARFSASRNEAGADFRISLHGEGLPTLSGAVHHLVWRGDALGAQTQFDARFDYGAFKDVGFRAEGALHWDMTGYEFATERCAQLGVKAFHTATDLVRDVSARLCPEGQPLFSGQGAHWRLKARAEEAKAVLPAATSALDQIAGHLSFEGEGGQFGGHVVIEKARLSDRAPALRFEPLSASGHVDYGQNVWRGNLAVKGTKDTALGNVEFTHAMANGKGSAHFSAPHITFAPKGFQPKDLSPLLASLRDAEGPVSFTGDVTWTPHAIASKGVLDVQGLQFVTPLGRAHDLKTRIAFSSLLPPRTQGTIPLSIARIDWALPITGLAMRFSLSPTQVRVDALSLDWAEGHVIFDPFTVALGASPGFSTIARLKDISLESLVGASNLGAKLKVSGRVSGSVPFAFGSQGVHVTDGRIAAIGPGRLSVDRSLWMQGDAAISSNAVQGFAYQALENLAYDSLSADLNTVAGRRLAILFHIKGKSAPPKPQTADVSILDILNGTALYKPIPLPSGTPIDLTLDTSLNFDELLKSYAQAWSEAFKSQCRQIEARC